MLLLGCGFAALVFFFLGVLAWLIQPAADWPSVHTWCVTVAPSPIDTGL